MAGFVGSEICMVDAKGRFAVPVRMRRHLDPEANDTFYVARSPDPCLNLYPLNEWAVYVEKLHAVKPGDPKARKYQRAILEGAFDVVLDSQGRINVPDRLLKAAGITKEVKVVGMQRRIELWNPERFEQHMAEMDQDELLKSGEMFEL